MTSLATRIWPEPETGDCVTCPCCGNRTASFLPFGLAQRPSAKCPSCGSKKRHRLLWLFLREQTEFFTARLRVLHFAPERCFRKRFQKLPNLDYVTADLAPEKVKLVIDITSIPASAGSFDAILCSHVLEHVSDDRQAMRELYRVLKPGGWAAVIARNVAVDAIRARARERRVFQHGWDTALTDDRSRPAVDLGPERLTDIHLTLDRVNRALAGLGPKKARVVYLHDVLGYELGEVATMLGTSVAAAQSRLVRGRREIVETMGPGARPGHGGAARRADAADGEVEARPRRRKRPPPGVLT